MKRNINEVSEGSKMLAGLSDALGIDDSDIRPTKTAKVTEVEQMRPFDPTNDAFKMTTHMLKVISGVADCFKDNVMANFRFDSEGVSIFSMHHARTVCITTHLGMDLFTDFSCEKEVYTSVNLNVFAKKVEILNKYKIQKLTFENKNEDLVLTGQGDSKPTASVRLKALTSDVEEVDISEFHYDVPFRLQSAEFSKIIDCMPGTFTIRMDVENGHLVFVGNEDHSVTILPMHIDPEVIEKIKQFDDVRNYQATFVKSNISAIGRGCKLSEYVVVAFNQENPLFVRYILNESADLNPDNNSSISMYFSPKLNDDIDE
jgi:proliferating cell nuclear antigen PCNA